MAKPNNGLDFPIRLEILPGTGRGSADHEFESETSGVPGLVREWTLLVLHVEGADGGELDMAVSHEHGSVFPELVLREWASDGEDCDSDHGAGLHADVGFHHPRSLLAGGAEIWDVRVAL